MHSNTLAIFFKKMQAIRQRSISLRSKNLESHRYIEKPSKELKSFARGEKFELDVSRNIHSKNTPVLISSKLLRRYNCGQIDICLYDQELIIYELKLNCRQISGRQYSRLMASQRLLASLLDLNTRLVIINKLPKTRSLLNLNI